MFIGGFMKFCKDCGAPIIERIPPGDDRLRFICGTCDMVHYENPRMVVGCVPEWEDRILLCRRAIEPRYGWWTIPAGYLELGETISEGAARETLEEAGARVEILTLYTVFNLTHISQVYLLFRARLLDLDFVSGEESLDVGLFDENDIPWKDLAFTPVKETLRLFFKDRPSGHFPLHLGDVP